MNDITEDPIYRDRELLRPGLALPKVGRSQAVRDGILRFLRRRRGKGATTEELSAALIIPQTTLQPRTTELHRQGLIECVGRRSTTMGRTARVWAVKGTAT